MNTRYPFYALTVCTLLSFSSCRVFRTISFGRKINKTSLEQSAALPQVLPFKYKNGRVYVSVRLQGKPDSVILIMDTGAPTILFSDSTNNQYNFDMRHVKLMAGTLSTPSAGAAKKAPTMSYAKNVTLDINGNKLHKKGMPVQGTGLASLTCDNAKGLLGADVLSKFGLYVDIRNRYMALHKKGVVPDSVKAYPFRIKFKKATLFQQSPYAHVTVLGTAYDAMFDMGANTTVLMQFDNEHTKEYQELLAKIPGKTRFETYAVHGDMKGFDTSKGELYRILIDTIHGESGKITFPAQKISVQPNGNLHEIKVNIGTGWMEQFVFFIDWDDKLIYLKPSTAQLQPVQPSQPKVTAKPIALRYLDARKALVVAMLDKNSKLYEKGVRAGAIVIRVNDKAVADLFKNKSACEADNITSGLNTKIENLELEIDGKQQKIEL